MSLFSLKGCLEIQRWSVFFSRWNALNCYLNKYCYHLSKTVIQVILSFLKEFNFQRQKLLLFCWKAEQFSTVFPFKWRPLNNVQPSVIKLWGGPISSGYIIIFQDDWWLTNALYHQLAFSKCPNEHNVMLHAVWGKLNRHNPYPLEGNYSYLSDSSMK